VLNSLLLCCLGGTSSSISLPPSVFGGIPDGQSYGMFFSFYNQSSLFPLAENTQRNPRFKISSPVIGATVDIGSLADNVTVNIALTNTVSLDIKTMYINCLHYNTEFQSS